MTGNFHGALLAVLAVDGVFTRGNGAVPFDGLGARSHPGGAGLLAVLHVGVHRGPPVFAPGNVVFGIAADLHKLVVAKLHEPVCLHQAHAHRQALQNAAQAQLAAAQAVFHLLAFGDVLHHGDVKAGRLARRPHRRHGEVHPQGVAILMEIALFHVVLGYFAGFQALQAGQVHHQVFGVADALKIGLAHLRHRVADDVGIFLIDAHKTPGLRVDLRHSHGRLPENGAETLFALAPGIVRHLRLRQGQRTLAPQQHHQCRQQR